MTHMKKQISRVYSQKSTAYSVTPTNERLIKGDYETSGVGKEKRTYRANTLLALRKSGRIDSAAESAALMWLREYLYAYAGYRDKNTLQVNENEPLPADAITAHLNRAKVAERLHYIRLILGNLHDDALKLMMVDGLTFRRMAEKLVPEKSATRGAEEVSILCASILNTLHGAYAMARKLQKECKNKTHRTKEPHNQSRIRANEFTGPS